MSILLYSEKAQPFGLLSNNAPTPFSIGGLRYQSVTEYVYSSLFSTPAVRDEMKKRLLRNPFIEAFELKAQEDAKTYLDGVMTAMRARYSQDLSFKNRLDSLRNKTFEIRWGSPDENRRLTMLFNQLLYTPHQVFYDESYGQVSFDRIKPVVAGVASELLKNPYLTGQTFQELEQRYRGAVLPVTGLEQKVLSMIESLDELVPVLKILLKDKIYANEIARFREHLLETTLVWILETHYPNLKTDSYGLAIAQQRVKEQARLARYESDLYNLYNLNALPNELVSRLQFVSSAPLSSDVNTETIAEAQSDTQSEVSSVSSASSSYRFSPTRIINSHPGNRTIIQNDDQLLPHHKTVIKIKGVEYTSAVAYAYSLLFQSIGIAVASQVLANDPLDALARNYAQNKHEVMANRLTTLNEQATRVKFQTYPELANLLLETKGAELVWADSSDSVLGTGKPLAPNRAGAFLMFLRNEYQKSRPQPTILTNPNIIATNWVRARIEDYANTLRMFAVKSQQTLALVYGVVPINANVNPIPEVVAIMKDAGLGATDQQLVLPLLVAEFKALEHGGVAALVAFYNWTHPTTQQRQRAELVLTNIYNRVKSQLLPNITAAQFTCQILSGQPIYDMNQNQWWKIHKWAAR